MDLNKDVPVQHALVGDAKLTLQGLIAEMDQLPKTTAEARKEAKLSINHI